MFWIGVLPAALAVYVRRHVRESDVFRANGAVRAPVDRGRASGIFSPGMWRVTLLASLVALGAQGGYYAITTWLPLYLNLRGLSVTHTGGYLGVAIAGSFAGYLSSAQLCDKLGRRWTLVVFALMSLTTVVLYTVLPLGDTATLVLGFPLGFFSSGSFSPLGAFFTELFPTAVRGSGQGFSYNLGRGIGALFPTLVGFFSAHMGLGYAIGIFAALAYAVMVAAVWLLPETRGKELSGQT
jgi:MFS family permease